MDVIPSLSLFVKVRKAGEKDRLGQMRYSYTKPQEVKGCLFAPVSTTDLEGNRPEGVTIKAVAYFPRGWATYLKRAKVLVPGTESTWLNVIGEPIEMPKEMLPSSWPLALKVELGESDG